jgi:hypothetical protein
MDTAVAVSTLVLTVLTAVYVFLTGNYVRLTSQALGENKHVNQLNQEAFDQQLGIGIYPHLFLSTRLLPNKDVQLSLYNSGTTPAYDIDVPPLSIYDASKDLTQFIMSHVRQDMRDRTRTIEGTERGTFGVYDRLAYYIMPQQRRVDVTLGCPPGFKELYALVQFRDVLGTTTSSYTGSSRWCK